MTIRNLALVGVGPWGANILRTISTSELLSVEAIASRKSREEIAAIAATESPVLESFHDLEDLIEKLDGVVLATPPDVRYEQIDFFLEHGLPIFAEKPLTLYASQTRRLIEKSRRYGVPLIEDFVYIYSWPYQTILNRAIRGELKVESRGGNDGPLRDYSPLQDYGPHDVAMALWLFQAVPSDLSARVFNYRSSRQFCVQANLDFGRAGTANLSFGNAFDAKHRAFKVTDGESEWIYDDLSPEQLLRNSIAQSAPPAPELPLTRALHSFAGHDVLVTPEESAWLSETVAEVLGRLTQLVAPQLRSLGGAKAPTD